MATFEPQLTNRRNVSASVCRARSGSEVATWPFHFILVRPFHFIYTEGSECQYAYQESQNSFQTHPDPSHNLQEKPSPIGIARAAAATRTGWACVMKQVWTEPDATLYQMSIGGSGVKTMIGYVTACSVRICLKPHIPHQGIKLV